MKIEAEILDDAPAFTALRRDLHANPELAFLETRTADIVRGQLASYGIEVVENVGKTGLVGIIKKGSSNRALGLRADMDALPINETSDLPHRSKVAGRMHACGHDGHTAMLLAAAKHLARTSTFDGTVYLIFQPGEESGRGALAMIEDGLFERFPMEAVFAAHNWPNLPVGSFAVAPGPMMASCNEFTIEVTGHGGHAAMPDLSCDPVQPACQIAIALQTIVSRNLPPAEAAVLSVTMINAGEAVHVIPNSAVLKGTIRTFSEEITDRMEAKLNLIVQSVAAAHGASSKVSFIRNCAPTVNHAAEAEFVRRALTDLVGKEAVQDFVPSMAAEDFSFMLQHKPGCYFMIGNGSGDHRRGAHGLGPCVLHNPSYDFNDSLIAIGAQAWVQIAERWLADPAS
jgi:amidohydrolase